MKRKKFPNKVIAEAYEKAIGKVFTCSPARQVFTDQAGNTDYNYHAMIWMIDHQYIISDFNLTERFITTYYISEKA